MEWELALIVIVKCGDCYAVGEQGALKTIIIVTEGNVFHSFCRARVDCFSAQSRQPGNGQARIREGYTPSFLATHKKIPNTNFGPALAVSQASLPDDWGLGA